MAPQFRSDLGLVVRCALIGVAGVTILYVIGFAFAAWDQLEKPTFVPTLSSIGNALFYGFMILPTGVICLLPYTYVVMWARRRWGLTNWFAHVALGTGYFTFWLALFSLYFDKGSVSAELENATKYLKFAGISVSVGVLFGTLFWLTQCWRSKTSTGDAR